MLGKFRGVEEEVDYRSSACDARLAKGLQHLL
jgi:hypothetical protein